MLQKEPGLESRSGPHGELHQDRPMGSSPFSQTAVTAQMQSQASGTTGHSLPPKGSGTEKKFQMGPQDMQPLVAELLGGGRPEFWACDQGPEDLTPLGSCEPEVTARKPEHGEEKVNRTRMANPADWEGSLGIQELSLEMPNDTRGPLSGSASVNFAIPAENTDIHN